MHKLIRKRISLAKVTDFNHEFVEKTGILTLRHPIRLCSQPCARSAQFLMPRSGISKRSAGPKLPRGVAAALRGCAA
ncbi:hypothetical protein AB0I98_47765, partial [Streptomyces sp. NPDC050211]|uniref:hypothetical protein n=1 Tax=Streptomyces sp. NPDC050211 TaxID=3154932 RepID=UPI00342FD368